MSSDSSCNSDNGASSCCYNILRLTCENPKTHQQIAYGSTYFKQLVRDEVIDPAAVEIKLQIQTVQDPQKLTDDQKELQTS